MHLHNCINNFDVLLLVYRLFDRFGTRTTYRQKMAQVDNINGLPNGASNGCPLGTNGDITGASVNGTSRAASKFTPVAICGMACRLPGGIASPQDFWAFLMDKKDGRIRTPKSRFNIDGYYTAGANRRPGTASTGHGYYLDDDTVDLSGIDTNVFSSMSLKEVQGLDPQQRLMLEVARESLDDAGEVASECRGKDVGVYVGSFGQDWYDIMNRDRLSQSVYNIVSSHDFMTSERISHELDLRGPRCVLC